MQLDWKKISIIALFITAVLLFAFFVYYFFFRPFIFTPDLPPTANTNANVNQELPGIININGRVVVVDDQGRLPISYDINGDPIYDPADLTPDDTDISSPTTSITDDLTLFTTTGANGQIIYYNPNDNKFYQVNADGSITAFHNQAFFNIQSVTWSNSKDKAILEYPDDSKIIYDFKSNQQYTIPKHWDDFSFSPNDQQIAFKSLALNPDNRFLTIAKNDGSEARVIERIGTNDYKVNASWSPNNQIIATVAEGKNLEQTEIFFIGLNQENFKLMTVEGRDFIGQWSPQGDKMLYSVYDPKNDYKPELWIADAQPDTIGNNRRKLNLQTWSDKCIFAGNDKVFCATPASLPFGVGLDPNRSTDASDIIYEINLQTGNKTVAAIPDGFYSIDNLIYNASGNNLFFRDTITNKTYKIEL